MGFSSFDHFIKEITQNGKFHRQDWNKNTFGTTAHTAGLWYCMLRGGGNPPADTILGSGTNLLWQQLKDTTANATGIMHDGNKYPDTKHLINAAAFSAAATTMPMTLQLVDLLGFYNITTVTTTGDQALTNTLIAFDTFTADAGTDIITTNNGNLLSYSKVQFSTTTTLPAGLAAATDYFVVRQTQNTFKVATSLANALAGTFIDITSAGTGTHTINNLLPRYTNGYGVRAFLTPSTVMGAATPNIRITYTDDQNNTGNLTPATLPIGNTAAAVTSIVYSGTGSGKFGPFMPLAIGDNGIRSVEQFNLSASYLSGVLNLVLAKPIITLPLTTIGVACERDFVNMLPSMPRIYDGACLAWLMYPAAATPINSAFYGNLDFGWGDAVL